MKEVTDKTQTKWLIALSVGMVLCLGVVIGLTKRPAVVVVNPPTPNTAASGPEIIAKFASFKANDGAEYGTGWQRDEQTIAASLADDASHFDKTPAGKAVMGDEDVYGWRAVQKVNNRGPPWYPNTNQKDLGSCVGNGFSHAIDTLLAIQILAGQAAEWKQTAVESVYGGSRVEIGGGRIRGDGSVGAWAKQSVEKIGTLAMEKHDGVDLTEYSVARVREWGKNGIPDKLEPKAREHIVKGGALVKSWADVKRSIQQGYPVPVCSDQGFTMERDKDGFCKPSGKWMHCMALIGVRGGARPGAFCLNSWGDNAHTGPVWPADAPVAGFWIDADVVDRMVRQGDSFALADANGFPARKLPDFFIVQPQQKWFAASRDARDLFHFLAP